MAAVFAFLGIWLISLVVAILAALQLGDFFGAGDEFPLVIAAIVAFGTVAMAIFGTGYALVRQARILQLVALGLAVLALAPIAVPGIPREIAHHSTNPYIDDAYFTLALVIPALLTVLVQWGLVRRRWLRARGDDDVTRWPWVTTAVGALVVLNPFGLSVVGAALRHSPTELLWELWAVVTAGATLVLVVMALFECYIRRRILRRRLARGLPPVATAAGPKKTDNGEVSG